MGFWSERVWLHARLPFLGFDAHKSNVGKGISNEVPFDFVSGPTSSGLRLRSDEVSIFCSLSLWGPAGLCVLVPIL